MLVLGRSEMATADYFYEVLLPSLNEKPIATTAHENADDKDPLFGNWVPMPPCM